MKSRANSILNIFLFLTLFVSTAETVPVWGGSSGFSASHGLLNFRKSETEWQRVNPPGEEFSILTPMTPTLFKQGGDYTLSGSSEKVLDHRSYGGYANGFLFYIESYKADLPNKLLKALEDNPYPKRAFESRIEIGGFGGKQYRIASQSFYGKYLAFVTKKHIYLITLASRDENNASVARFISSFILGDKIIEPATWQVLDVKDNAMYQSAISSESDTALPQGQVYKPKDVSRKASIVSKPEPAYTEEARRKQVHGTVILRGVFDADGQVGNIRVMRGLEGGLTGKAIEAALAIRYFPAEKDGQPVSQYIQIEYNFNLY